MCQTQGEAEQALAQLTAILAELGLEPKAAKTRIVHLTEGGDGFDFLGFHHRLVRARGRRRTKRVLFLARWPSRRAAQHALDRIRSLTGRSRLLVPLGNVVQEVDSFLRIGRHISGFGFDRLVRQDCDLRGCTNRSVRGQATPPQPQPRMVGLLPVGQSAGSFES
jgi:hypothetical protein